MDDSKNKIGKIIEGLNEAEGLLDLYLTDEHKSHMTADNLEQLAKMKQLTGVDLKKAAEGLMSLNNKY